MRNNAALALCAFEHELHILAPWAGARRDDANARDVSPAHFVPPLVGDNDDAPVVHLYVLAAPWTQPGKQVEERGEAKRPLRPL
jgi:hypothetical protein